MVRKEFSVFSAPDPVKPPFEEIYDRYYFDVLRYLIRHMNNRQDAEDLAGDVFLYCYSHYDNYDPAKSSVATWLYLVVNSRLKNYYRDRRETVDISELEPFLAAEEDDMGKAVYLQQLRGALAAAIQQLPERQQQVVILRYFQEKSYAEIADALGTSENNARVMMTRALTRLESLCEALK